MYMDPDGGSADAAGFGDSSFDALSADAFTQEIENVSASDWDVDTDLLWGDPEPIDDPSADGIDPGFFT
jgi:hypothetical protein